MPLETILNIQSNANISVIQEKTAIVEELKQLSDADQAPWITNAETIAQKEQLSTSIEELLSKVSPRTTGQ